MEQQTIEQALAHFAVQTAHQWVDSFKRIHESRHSEILSDLEQSVFKCLNDVVGGIAARKAKEVIEPQMEALADQAFNRWVNSGAVWLPEPTEQVKQEIERVLLETSRSIRKSVSAARRRKIQMYRMVQSGVSIEDVASHFVTRASFVKKAIESCKAESERIRSDYEMYFGEM